MTVRTLLWLRTLGFVLALLAGGGAARAPPADVGRPPVSSQADGARGSALPTALATVGSAQSGEGGVLADAAVAGPAGQAERYVLLSSYERNPGGAAPLLL